EELGLLSLLEKVAGFSPAALASASLPILVAAILAVVLIPDDSSVLVVAQTVVASTLAATATGLFVGSIVLEGLQEAD
ncbi:putative ribonuclease H-like domain-containing protein, partial [Tanacetum coccineum]